MITRPKPTVTVTFESTIVEGANYATRELGRVIPGIKEALSVLSNDNDVIVVSQFASDNAGVKRLRAFLNSNAIPFAGVWCGFGYPPHSERYDNGARVLKPGKSKRVKETE